LAPRDFLPWLAALVDLDPGQSLDEAHQRQLVHQAVNLYKFKGTRRVLRELLALILKITRILVVENFDGLRLGPDALLGINTTLGTRSDGDVFVTLLTDAGATVDLDAARALAERLVPADVSVHLRVAGGKG
jgi:P2-related tail formation protein